MNTTELASIVGLEVKSVRKSELNQMLVLHFDNGHELRVSAKSYMSATQGSTTKLIIEFTDNEL